jgi:hypothetical protein
MNPVQPKQKGKRSANDVRGRERRHEAVRDFHDRPRNTKNALWIRLSQKIIFSPGIEQTFGSMLHIMVHFNAGDFTICAMSPQQLNYQKYSIQLYSQCNGWWIFGLALGLYFNGFTHLLARTDSAILIGRSSISQRLVYQVFTAHKASLLKRYNDGDVGRSDGCIWVGNRFGSSL